MFIFYDNTGVPGQPLIQRAPQPFPGQPIQHQQQDLSIPPAQPFTPSQPFNPQQISGQQQQQQQQQIPVLLPIGNIPLQGQQPPPQPAAAPVSNPNIPAPPPPPPAPQPTAPVNIQQQQEPALLLPAQFALSGNTLLQQQQQSRKGKSLSVAASGQTQLIIEPNKVDLVDCGAGNDLGFCAVSEKYPR